MTLGVGDLNGNSDVLLTPNLVTTQLTLHSTKAIGEAGIYDGLGRKMLELNLKAGGGQRGLRFVKN